MFKRLTQEEIWGDEEKEIGFLARPYIANALEAAYAEIDRLEAEVRRWAAEREDYAGKYEHLRGGEEK